MAGAPWDAPPLLSALQQPQRAGEEEEEGSRQEEGSDLAHPRVLTHPLAVPWRIPHPPWVLGGAQGCSGGSPVQERCPKKPVHGAGHPTASAEPRRGQAVAGRSAVLPTAPCCRSGRQERGLAGGDGGARLQKLPRKVLEGERELQEEREAVRSRGFCPGVLPAQRAGEPADLWPPATRERGSAARCAARAGSALTSPS